MQGVEAAVGAGGPKAGGFFRRAAAGSRAARSLGVLALLLLAGARTAAAGSVTLEWDPNTEPDLKGYRLHYGLESRTYPAHLDVGRTTTWPVEGLDESRTYFFAVTAYDTSGNESTFSNEVSARPAASGPEAVSTPHAPTGPALVEAGATHTYSVAGAISSRGDAVQFQFSWADGTVSGWLPVGTTSAQKSWASPGVYSSVRVQARCAAHPSVVSAESAPLAVTVSPGGQAQEEVSRPFAPRGPASGEAGVAYTYEAGGALSSTGDPVQYRFSWSDGTDSGWLPVGTTAAAKSWNAAGSYAEVRLEARCASHPAVVSAPSPSLTVIIEGQTEETVTPPDPPSGPESGTTWTAYAYASGGASSNLGHTLLYRFHWGDGEVSGWVTDPAAAWHSWESPGAYEVRVEAVCVLHHGIYALSDPLPVVLSERDPRIFFDDFTATGDWTARWNALSGRWGIGGRRLSLASTSIAKIGRILVRPVQGIFAGRVEGRFKLTKAATRAPNAGLIFSYRDRRHYRYVLIRGTRVSIGEVGASEAEAARVSQAIPRRLALAKWHRVRLDLHPDGTAAVYLDGHPDPAVVHRFTDVLPGRIGVLTGRARTYYDDFAVWDGTVLPEGAPPETAAAADESEGG